MDYNLATHIMSFMGLGAGLTVVGIIALFKVADWLIGLKYKSKDECSKTRHEWSAKIQHDYANKKVNFTGEGEFMLVLNEVKLYDERKTCKDFVMKKEDYVGGVMVPRVFKTNIGDIFTTNMIDPEAEITAGTTKLTPGENGILTTATGTEEMIWKVVKVYTMADGQAAVKLQRIK